jgi:hypothetical protein
MKYTAAALVLALASTDAYSVSRSSLRQLSQPKQVQAARSQQNVGSAMKMEGMCHIIRNILRVYIKGLFIFARMVYS